MMVPRKACAKAATPGGAFQGAGIGMASRWPQHGQHDGRREPSAPNREPRRHHEGAQRTLGELKSAGILTDREFRRRRKSSSRSSNPRGDRQAPSRSLGFFLWRRSATNRTPPVVDRTPACANNTPSMSRLDNRAYYDDFRRCTRTSGTCPITAWLRRFEVELVER